jgi:4-hydroxybenzoyl-CoA reductase subunit beta
MERIAPFVLERPATLAEAVALLAAAPGARPLAGGTDLLPNLRDGIGESPMLVDLGGIDGFSAMAVERDGTTIGAGVTLARIASDATLAGALPALAEAAAAVAGPGHRTVATLGGNLCLDTRCVFYNQSEWWRRANDFCLKHGGDVCHVAPQGKHCHAAFSGDLAPVLLVQGATVEIVGPAGARRLPLAEFYLDDGARHLSLAPGEIIAAVRIPAQPASARTGYRKARARGAIDFPLAGVAARVAMDDGRLGALRVALTGTNARPFLLDGTNALIGAAVTDETLTQLGKLVQKQVSPMRTTVTHSYYRRQVAAVLAQRLVRELAAEPTAGARGASG